MRGAYQFFRADEDPIAQADLLIAKVGGKLSPGDLPPVIDVESSDGQSGGTIARKVRAWLDRAESKLHVKPIVYTGPYFWRDSVGGADVNDHPLWVAHYGTSCPLVPPTWNRWTFHQFTSSGRISGISGNVDVNHFNGTLTQLKDLAVNDDRPAQCVSGRFRGELCDDDNSGGEEDHDRLVNDLDVNFHCSDIAGSPAFCPSKSATRAQAMFVLGKAADMPLADHPNAFRDDNGHRFEKYMNTAKAYGILIGNANREGKPDGIATRDQIAVFLPRMYKLPAVDRDYFVDDDGTPEEAWHNKVGAAGLFAGYDDGRGGREFRGDVKVPRDMLTTLALRAHDGGLVPVWAQ
jgi:hypothetical protein